MDLKETVYRSYIKEAEQTQKQRRVHWKCVASSIYKCSTPIDFLAYSECSCAKYQVKLIVRYTQKYSASYPHSNQTPSYSLPIIPESVPTEKTINS